MFELATDFSKLTKIPQFFYVNQNLSDEEILKQARFFIKQRILTNLDVPTWDTQFNYYNKDYYSIFGTPIFNDKYIRYEHIIFFLDFIKYVELRDFEKFIIYSEFDRESNPYRSELHRYTERGSIGAGVWILELTLNNNLNYSWSIRLVLYPNFYFYTEMYVANEYYSSETFENFKITYNRFRIVNHD
jgi:hypothetical protein